MPAEDPHLDAAGDTTATKATMAATGAAICCQLVIWIGMGIFWLVIYLQYKDVICEDPLPTWCLVNCIVAFCSLPGACLTQAIKMHGKQQTLGQTSKSVMCLSCVTCLLAIFHLVWFILGNAWAWGQNQLQCDWDLLYTIRVYLVVLYVFLGIGCCCGCLMSSLGPFARKKG